MAGNSDAVTGSATSRGALILKRSDVQRLASPADHVRAVVAGFRAFAEGSTHTPPPMEVDGAAGAFHAKGASMEIDGRRIAAVKVNANFPGNPERFGLPTIQGAILLSDAGNGELLAIIDSIEVTLRRTAAASAAAADALALKTASTLLICGCGAQARAHLEAMREIRPIRQLFAFDLDGARARRLAEEAATEFGLKASATGDLRQAALDSDIIVTTTTAKSPLALPADLRPGTFIAAVGADNPLKNEIAPSLMAQAAVVADVTDQCAAMGDLRAAIAAGAMERSDVRAELGDVVAGKKPGRKRDDEIVIFDSTGAAFQDVTAAWMVFKRASAAGRFARIDLRS